jgi:hypothetical protein
MSSDAGTVERSDPAVDRALAVALPHLRAAGRAAFWRPRWSRAVLTVASA